MVFGDKVGGAGVVLHLRRLLFVMCMWRRCLFCSLVSCDLCY